MKNSLNKPQRRDKRLECSEDVPSNPSERPTFGDLVNRRMGRREFLMGTLAVSAAAGALKISPALCARARAGEPDTAAARFGFSELEASVDATHHVADGYDADVLIRWGDPVVPGAPAFDPMRQSADAQERQFGYNNDYIGYLVLPLGSANARHGLLCINHEYTNAELMFPSYARDTAETVEIEMAAHGASIVEVRRGADGKWRCVSTSRFNRRISSRRTAIGLSGPAAGHARLRTTADPGARQVKGTLHNCGGGITPWGTYLLAEENFHYYFGGRLPEEHPEQRNHSRYAVPGGAYGWHRYHQRFDVGHEPNEPNRFGWIVEVDPYDPRATPVKRTALGRFKHEGAATVLNADNRVVVYMGDDQCFEYVYKFVSRERFDPHNRAANRNLLDSGTLFVAKLSDDGTFVWLPLVFGTEALTPGNGFHSQADVVIEARRAADLLSATPMDRPEDVEANPKTGTVYVMLTNNALREPDDTNSMNPRGPNLSGHIVELIPENGDHGSTRGRWDLLVACGDPTQPHSGARWHPKISADGWFAGPDNCAVDARGRLWVATDGNSAMATGRSDGIWAIETDGERRGLPRHFFRGPVGAELCGPAFSPDDETLFLAVQHPAEAGEEWPAFARKSTFEDPSTRWPDFRPDMPPRPAVVVVTKKGGGKIG